MAHWCNSKKEDMSGVLQRVSGFDPRMKHPCVGDVGIEKRHDSTMCGASWVPCSEGPGLYTPGDDADLDNTPVDGEGISLEVRLPTNHRDATTPRHGGASGNTLGWGRDGAVRLALCGHPRPGCGITHYGDCRACGSGRARGGLPASGLCLHSGRQHPMLGKGRLRRWCWAPAR